jgi:AraC-like DNA-binding protein
VRRSGAVVSGAYRQYFAIDPRRHASIMGVHFRPGGAWPFVCVPADELADAHVDLEALWGSGAATLRERLCAADSAAERFKIMERALAGRLCDGRRGHGAVAAALREFARAGGAAALRDGVCVGDVARRVGLSRRRFIAVFRAEVGMTPKLYCRVLRFQRSLAAARASGRPQWARLAPEVGYADQSHLVREFREFCGLSPTECLRQFGVPAKLNHVPLTA